jgi:hypothetical protein
MLETQRTMMRTNGTATKRLNRLHSFVVTQEKQRVGQAGAEAARASASSFDVGQHFGDYEAPSVATQEYRIEPLSAAADMLPESSSVADQADTEQGDSTRLE